MKLKREISKGNHNVVLILGIYVQSVLENPIRLFVCPNVSSPVCKTETAANNTILKRTANPPPPTHSLTANS